jgi:mannosyltransferase OCH1-like enzyme
MKPAVFVTDNFGDMSDQSVPGETHLLNVNRIIQGLWIGPKLSILEQLSIASFLQNGHEYHLYTYNELPNVPAGTIIKDGNEILPASAIFQYTERPSYAGFANFFRYKLLLERGGWWADTDMVCLRPFDFPEEYVFSSEMNAGREVTNIGAIKAFKGSEAIAHAWSVCQAKEPSKLTWGETGPRLMSEVVQKYRLGKYQKPYYIFCPISDWHKFLEPYVAGVHEDAYAIHLWSSTWDLFKQDKDAMYHPACIYEQLKTRYL